MTGYGLFGLQKGTGVWLLAQGWVGLFFLFNFISGSGDICLARMGWNRMDGWIMAHGLQLTSKLRF